MDNISGESPEIISALLTKRQILVQNVDVFLQARIVRLIFYLNSLNESPITLLIDSNGGDTALSLCICDAIEHSQAEVRGLVVADAHSAAFRILQSCHRRIAYPNARLLFHAPALSGLRIDSNDWAKELKETRELHEEQIRVFAERSKQPIKQIRAWSKKEKYFTAPEAKKLGFLDEVAKPTKK